MALSNPTIHHPVNRHPVQHFRLSGLAGLIGLLISHTVMAEPVIDSDFDGVSDETEILYGLDANKHYDAWRDEDGDHLPQIIELIEAT